MGAGLTLMHHHRIVSQGDINHAAGCGAHQERRQVILTQLRRGMIHNQRIGLAGQQQTFSLSPGIGCAHNDNRRFGRK